MINVKPKKLFLRKLSPPSTIAVICVPIIFRTNTKAIKSLSQQTLHQISESTDSSIEIDKITHSNKRINFFSNHDIRHWLH